MRIDTPKLSEILPQSLKSDEKILAAAEYLDEELKKLSCAIKQVLHLPRLDELPSDVLDHLAWQYHVDNYSADFSEEIKRKMIRESIYLHRIKGTPEAVRLALKAFSDNPEISEWFEYEGKEYFFKVILHDLRDVGDDGETLLRAIYDSKNVRSWLEEILFEYSDGILAKRYHAAHEMHGGEIFTEINDGDQFDSDKIFHAIAEATSGNIFTELDISLEPIKSKISSAIAETEGGEILTELSLNPKPIHSTFSTAIAELAGGFEFTAMDSTQVEWRMKNER